MVTFFRLEIVELIAPTALFAAVFPFIFINSLLGAIRHPPLVER
jgi:hypothetical protein